MAAVKLKQSKSAANSIAYADARAEVKSGINCNPDNAKAQFEATRKIWGKNDSIQAHTVIHSFSPNEVTPEQANKLGKQLAEKIAPGYEVAIFTHADKDHIHNHIIINSVHPDTGKKYHCHGWEGLESVRNASNSLSAAHGLTIPYLPEEKRVYGEFARYSEPAPIRYSHAEQVLLEQGKKSWRDEIRQALDNAVKSVGSYEELRGLLKKEYSIDMNDKGKYVTFTNGNGQKARGHKLGHDYSREGLKNGIDRQIAGRGATLNATANRAVAAIERSKQGGAASVLGSSLGDSIERIFRGDTGADNKFNAVREVIHSRTATGRAETAEAQRRSAENARILEQQQRAALNRVKKRSSRDER